MSFDFPVSAIRDFGFGNLPFHVEIHREKTGSAACGQRPYLDIRD
jgi:hypothetical protein